MFLLFLKELFLNSRLSDPRRVWKGDPRGGVERHDPGESKESGDEFQKVNFRWQACIVLSITDPLWAMDLHRYSWIFMDIHACPWISKDVRGYPWICMDIHGYPWISMDIHEYSRMSVDIHGYSWISMDIHGSSMEYPWISKDLHG